MGQARVERPMHADDGVGTGFGEHQRGWTRLTLGLGDRAKPRGHRGGRRGTDEVAVVRHAALHVRRQLVHDAVEGLLLRSVAQLECVEEIDDVEDQPGGERRVLDHFCLPALGRP